MRLQYLQLSRLGHEKPDQNHDSRIQQNELQWSGFQLVAKPLFNITCSIFRETNGYFNAYLCIGTNKRTGNWCLIVLMEEVP